MANFCTNCGSELNPGAKFCVNCGQKVEQEQNPQAEAVATTVAGVVAGAASSADISYKKSINDSPKQEGFVAANAQENVHTDANADTNGNSNPKVNPDEFKHTNTAGEVNTDAYSAQAAPKAGKKFLNLGEGLDLLFKDSSADKEAVFKELFFTSAGRLNRKSYIYRSIFLSLVLGIIQGILELATVAIEALELLFAVLLLALCIFGFVAGIMMLARRLHDLDKSGWWMLLLFVPLVNILFYIYILFFKGTEGPKQYGEDPLQQ